MHRKHPVPASIVNPEVTQPRPEFEATIADRKGCMDELWPCSREALRKYVLDRCEAWVDWAVGEKDLTRPRDTLDDVDWDMVHQQECKDKDEMPELEGSVYDQLGATPASTLASTNTEAATDMKVLSIALPETLVSNLPDSCPNLWIQIPPVRHVETIPPSTGLGELVSTTLETVLEHVSWDGMLQVAEQFQDMFKKPAGVVWAMSLPRVKYDDIQALLAQAKQRDLPPPLGLPYPPLGDPDCQNVVLQAVMGDRTNRMNADPLGVARDTARDAAWERQRRESHSRSDSSCSSSSKHWSSSWSKDETDPKRGRQTLTGDQNRLVAASMAPPPPTLNWNQDILEPQEPSWKPAGQGAPTTPIHAMKSVVAQPLWNGTLSRGQILKDKTKNSPVHGPAAASRHSSHSGTRKKQVGHESKWEWAWKPGLPT